MFEPPIDVSNGKATCSSSKLENDASGIEAHLDLKSSKISPNINPIHVIPIQVVSPSVQSSHQMCYIYEAKHAIHVQLAITLPSETHQSSQPLPPTSPLRKPNYFQSQPLEQVASKLQIRIEQVVQDLSLVQIAYESTVGSEQIPFGIIHPKISLSIPHFSNHSSKPGP